MDTIGISSVTPTLDLSENEVYANDFRSHNKYTSAWSSSPSLTPQQHSTANGRAVVSALKALQDKLSRLQADKQEFKNNYEKTRELLMKKEDEHALSLMQVKSDLSAANEFSDALKAENKQLKRQLATYAELVKKQKVKYAQDKQMLTREFEDTAQAEREQHNARLEVVEHNNKQAEQKSKDAYKMKLQSMHEDIESAQRIIRLEREASAENARRLEVSEDDVVALRRQVQTLAREKTELQTALIGFQSSAKAQLTQLKKQLEQQRLLTRKKEKMWSQHLEEHEDARTRAEDETENIQQSMSNLLKINRSLLAAAVKSKKESSPAPVKTNTRRRVPVGKRNKRRGALKGKRGGKKTKAKSGARRKTGRFKVSSKAARKRYTHAPPTTEAFPVSLASYVAERGSNNTHARLVRANGGEKIPFVPSGSGTVVAREGDHGEVGANNSHSVFARVQRGLADEMVGERYLFTQMH